MMEQLNFDFTHNWDNKEEVKTPVNAEHLKYDEWWAKSMGYSSPLEMITHNNKKHREMKIKYGSEYIQGWM